MLRKFPPSVVALILQFTALLIVSTMMRFMDWHGPLLLIALCGGMLAAVLSVVVRLAKWWWLIQLLFAPALVLMLGAALPPVIFLGAFVISLLVYWSTFRTQVPLYLSSDKVWHALENYLPSSEEHSGFSFIDLGSGLGGVLTHLASVRLEGRYFGVEAAPLPFMWSWLRIRLGGYGNCKVHWGSLWQTDLSQYDVVFAYLSPVPMERLWVKARAEMCPGSKFISSTFNVFDQPPQETVQVDDLHYSILYVWVM